jgi:hypothetical protein
MRISALFCSDFALAFSREMCILKSKSVSKNKKLRKIARES